jgi:hypothetical protein
VALEGEHPDCLGLLILAVGHEIVPIAIEEAVRMDGLVSGAARAAIAVVDPHFPARLDGKAQNTEYVRIDALARTRSQRKAFGLGKGFKVGLETAGLGGGYGRHQLCLQLAQGFGLCVETVSFEPCIGIDEDATQGQFACRLCQTDLFVEYTVPDVSCFRAHR